jgi:hypothetical protein
MLTRPGSMRRASAATGTSGKALSTAEQRLVRYSVTLESVGGGGAGAGQGGRRAGRRAAGPVTFELPDEDDGWENIQVRASQLLPSAASHPA